jgi:pimeloyl-ACP methyl ester carboxylesterase
VYGVNIKTVVVISGAGGDAFYWHRVAPLLRDAGYDVVTPELPSGDESAGIDEYTDAVVAAVGERRGLAVVGQSLGAFTAAAVCERLPVELLVFVAGMIPTPGETAGQWWDATGQADAQRRQDILEGRDPDAPMDTMTTFLHDVPPTVLADVLAAGEPAQSTAPFATPFTATAWRSVPTRAIAGKLDRLFPLPFMRELAQDRLGLEPDVIDSGHLPAFSRPGDLARMILGYVREVERHE